MSDPTPSGRASHHGERTRAGGFILRGRGDSLEVLLMRRFKAGRGEYYVVPGGSVEDGESLEAAAVRELSEETGVAFRLTGKLYESVNPSSNRVGHYFAAQWNSGEPHLHAQSPESVERQSAENRYQPLWVAAGQVCGLPLFPSVIRDRLCQDLLKGFGDDPIRLEETD
jgi:8-oxo-dGTP diphosphatase